MRKVVFAYVFLLCSSLLFGQENKWTFGLKTGGGISNMYRTNKDVSFGNDNSLTRPAFLFNGFVARSLGKRTFLSIEPGVVVKGERQTVFLGPSTTTVQDYVFVYGQLGILFGYKPTAKWRISAGPEWSYLLHEETGFFDWADQKSELSASIQAAYQINEALSFGLKANHAISSVFSIDYTDENGASLGVQDFRNQYAVLFAQFRLK